MFLRGLPSSAPATGGGTIGGAVTGGTAGSVLFVDASTNLGQDNANFYWDDTNNRLGIGTATPGATLDVDLTNLSTNSEVIMFRSNAVTQTITAGVTSSRFNQFTASTITAATAQTVDNAATLYVSAAPVAAGSAVITDTWAVWVDAGASRFDGPVTLGGADAGVPTTVLLEVGGSFTAPAGLNSAIADFSGTITEAASGVHALLGGLFLNAPAVTAGVATVTNTATLYVSAAMTATVTGTNYAVWVDSGTARFDGVIIVGGGEGGTPAGNTLRGPNAAGTDVAGAALTMQGGLGTGTGACGTIILKGATAKGTTGTVAHTASNIMVIGNTHAAQVDTAGAFVQWVANTYTDRATAGSGTASNATAFGFAQPTFAAENASVTTTNAATVYIADAPAAGTNMTLTGTYALWIDGGGARVDTTATIASATSAVLDAFTLPASTITISGSTAITTATGFNLINIGQPTYSNASIAVTIGATLYIADAPAFTGGGSLTTGHALWVDAGGARIDTALTRASAASATLNAISIPADTITISGSTNITTAGGFNLINIGSPTYSGTVTITHSATLHIIDAPTASGTTLTNKYALWVDDGNARFDGHVIVGGGEGGTPGAGVLRGPIASGNNVSADTLNLTAGKGTGTGDCGKIAINAYGSKGTSGAPSTVHTAITIVQFGNTHAAQVGQVGAFADFYANTYLDRATASSGTAADATAFRFDQPTFNAANTNVTTTNAVTLRVASCPVKTGNQTFTNAVALQVGSSDASIGGTTTGMTYTTINVPAHTITVTGTTQVTSRGFSALGLDVVTVTDTDAVTIDNAATLYIAGTPAQAGSVTITNKYAIWVDAGNSRLDGKLSVGVGSTPSATIHAGGDISAAAWTTTGIGLRFDAATYTDTSSSGTVAVNTAHNLAAPVFAASSATTYTTAATLRIVPPSAGTNVTITTSVSLICTGATRLEGRVTLGQATNPSAKVHMGGATSASAWGVSGIGMRFDATTYTDTSSSGTVATAVAHGFAAQTLAASSATTYTDAATFYIAAGPTAGSNVTITNGLALWVAAGYVRLDAGMMIGASSTNNLFDDASNGAGTTVMYIGNASITTSSDIRLKKDVKPTEMNALHTLGKLQVVDYTWNDPSDTASVNRNSRGRWVGMIAQEMVDVIPWIINAPDRTCKTCRAGLKCELHKSAWFVEYEHLVPLLVKGFQEVDDEIGLLHQQIHELNARITSLESKRPRQ